MMLDRERPPSWIGPGRAELRRSASSCAHWIRAAVGGDAATVRVAVPDVGGRLRVIACQGGHEDSGRLRSARRRMVFDSGLPIHMPINGSPGLVMGILPIGIDGDRIGVVEILAPPEKVIGREDVLLALVGQSELVMSAAGLRAQTASALEGMTAISRLATEMIGAKTAAEAVRVTVDVCFEYLGTPVAGILPDRDGWGWFLAGSGGLGARRRSELRTALRTPNSSIAPNRPRDATLQQRFQRITDSRAVVAVRAKAAVLLFGDCHEGHGQLLDRAGSVLAAALSELSVGRPSQRQDQARDLGIALIAHELKSPLAGVRAAIERVLETHAGPEGRELLRRTEVELRQLADLIDPLLHWSMGTETLRRQPIDLIDVVREAVTSSSFESGDQRLLIDAVDHPVVLADAPQLRGAIANVIRNSFSYSPPGSPVKVRVESDHRVARVEVKDRGPGVPPDERQLMFDPFERGRVGRSARSGSGLGLFIARRVLEAHGGSISLRPTRSGSAFLLELPLLEGRKERFAS
jgi:signal transduction histidine kinase